MNHGFILCKSNHFLTQLIVLITNIIQVATKLHVQGFLKFIFVLLSCLDTHGLKSSTRSTMWCLFSHMVYIWCAYLCTCHNHDTYTFRWTVKRFEMFLCIFLICYLQLVKSISHQLDVFVGVTEIRFPVQQIRLGFSTQNGHCRQKNWYDTRTFSPFSNMTLWCRFSMESKRKVLHYSPAYFCPFYLAISCCCHPSIEILGFHSVSSSWESRRRFLASDATSLGTGVLLITSFFEKRPAIRYAKIAGPIFTVLNDILVFLRCFNPEGSPVSFISQQLDWCWSMDA